MGRRLDIESDLYYFRARQFDAVLGRFLTRDVERYADGAVMYAGFGQMPYDVLDPTGNIFGFGARARHDRQVMSTGATVIARLRMLGNIGCGTCLSFGFALGVKCAAICMIRRRYGYRDFCHCMKEEWNKMPTWAKAAIGASCVACAVRAVDWMLRGFPKSDRSFWSNPLNRRHLIRADKAFKTVAKKFWDKPGIRAAIESYLGQGRHLELAQYLRRSGSFAAAINNMGTGATPLGRVVFSTIGALAGPAAAKCVAAKAP